MKTTLLSKTNRSNSRSPYEANCRRVSNRKVRLHRVPQNWHVRVVHRVLDDLAWLLPRGDVPRLKGAVSTSLAAFSQACEPYSLMKIGLSDPPMSGCEAAARRLVASIVQKYDVGLSSREKRDVAIENSLLSERICSRFNREEWTTLASSDYLPLMREFVSRTIGDLLPTSDQLCLCARHGPGSVFGQVIPKSCAKYYKYSAWPYSVTQRARQYAVDTIRNDLRWLGAIENDYRSKNGIAPWQIINWEAFWDNTLMVISGNRVTTVPKDWSKDRPIAIEPTLNMYLQLGVDGFIRKRLKDRWGIDLNNQSRNQELARAGSCDPTPMSPATIDLSMASDTISLRLAKMLLPAPWYEYLCAIRSPKGQYPDGKVKRYSKLSSMGNGTTFAIESLIFGAICFAVAKNARFKWKEARISVYGDDLTIIRALAPDLIHLLHTSGFSPNLEKSFWDNIPIRESCGTDWYRAYPVRGVYLKGVPQDLPDLFHAHNALWLWSQTHGIPLTSTLAYLKAEIDSEGGQRFVGPPDPERTNQYLFTEDASEITGIARALKSKTPRDWFFGKLLASLSGSVTDDHPWNPFNKREYLGEGSVFTSSGRHDWYYVTYNQRPSDARLRVNDAQHEVHSYLVRR